MEQTGFFQAKPGDNSSTRLASFIIILFALLDVQLILYFGKDTIMMTVTAAGTLFATMTGPTMIWMYYRKELEIKSDADIRNSEPPKPI
jgi:hypothetical protein